MKKSKTVYWLFLLPCLCAFSIAVIIPFFTGLYTSLTNWDGIHANSAFIGVANYVKVLNESYFQQSFLFTMKFVVCAVILENIVAFALSMLVTQKVRTNTFFRSVYFMPNLIGGVLVGFAWQFILRDVFETIGKALNIPFLCNWLSTTSTGFWGLVIVVIWQSSGYLMLVYIAQIQNIPDSLLEAASIDGANSYQVFKKIKLPLMMPAFTISLFLSLTSSFKLYDQNLTLTAGGPAKTTEMLTMNIFNTAYVLNKFGEAQAKGIIFLVIVAIISVSQLMYTKRKEVEM